MRLLTHNSLQNNAADAKGKGFPLQITATEISVADASEQLTDRQVNFVKSILPNLNWSALVSAAKEMGIPTLPPSLTEDLVQDPQFIQALHHILMNVHLVKGILTCPVTQREFPVQDGIPNMIIDEEDCIKVRF